MIAESTYDLKSNLILDKMPFLRVYLSPKGGICHPSVTATHKIISALQERWQRDSKFRQIYVKKNPHHLFMSNADDDYCASEF